MNESMKSYVDYFMETFSELTNEELDFLEDVLTWSDTKKAAFIFAKRIFEENDQDE